MESVCLNPQFHKMWKKMMTAEEYYQTLTAKVKSYSPNKSGQSRGASNNTSGPMGIDSVNRNGEAAEEDAGDVDEVCHFARDCRLKGTGNGSNGGKAQGKDKCKAGMEVGGTKGAAKAGSNKDGGSGATKGTGSSGAVMDSDGDAGVSGTKRDHALARGESVVDEEGEEETDHEEEVGGVWRVGRGGLTDVVKVMQRKLIDAVRAVQSEMKDSVRLEQGENNKSGDFMQCKLRDAVIFMGERAERRSKIGAERVDRFSSFDNECDGGSNINGCSAR